ncbi:MAG: Fic family protein [Nitrospirae bacterium]|nr:Fic family protein [Nitrospirota bacterium]
MAYEPLFQVTGLLVEWIEKIAALREKILMSTLQAPWVPKLQRDSRTRTAHSSTAIEGNPLTLEKVRALAEGKSLPDATPRSKREVLNHLAALRYVEKNSSVKVVTHGHVLEIHRLISTGVMQQGEAGRYRDIQVRVGKHMPPPPLQVSGLMSELLAWWNDRSLRWSPVITSAVVHHRFEDIHPFADGNGRTGRILALWELYRRGFDTQHIFSVDEFYWNDRHRYYEALDEPKRADGNLTSWLEYTAEGVHVTLENVWGRIREWSTGCHGEKLLLRPKQEQLLELLRDRGGMRPAEIWKALKISKQGALDLLTPLIDAKLVERSGTRKSGRYTLA